MHTITDHSPLVKSQNAILWVSLASYAEMRVNGILRDGQNLVGRQKVGKMML
jgi:hypothetical protein